MIDVMSESMFSVQNSFLLTGLAKNVR